MAKELTMKVQVVDGVPEVTPATVFETLKDMQAAEGGREAVRLIDVRTAEEFGGELGHIEGAELVTLGPELQRWIDEGDRSQTVVFICRVGGRSAQATMYAQAQGYTRAMNLQGGMMRWRGEGL
ncbi:MAG: rhodanese-like domain-containing protein [Bdellovibrionales bacterium]|jgi:hydroxyacylglutathione hydrolase|nr:rhodanese-like domain-containing protein [Bdellovibrionales bacterium]